MDFADRLAAPTPTPGGGAAAARAGLYAVSLVRMVAGITLEKTGERAAAEKVGRVASVAASLASDFRRHETADISAFEGFMAALRLPRGTDEEKALRRAARLEAAEEATEVPLQVMASSLQVLDLVSDILRLGGEVRLRAESDLGGAVELAHAAFRTAEWNVRVNVPLLGSSPKLEEFEERWRLLRERMAGESTELRQKMLELLGSGG